MDEVFEADEVFGAEGNFAADEVFKALADGSRRRLLDRLNARNGQSLRELCAGLGMARQSVSKHLALLEAAHLVTTVRRGREKLHYLNAEPINAIADRWISRYDRERARTLADLKLALEGTPMDSNAFVYATYIRSTPEQVWRGLTDPGFTRRYWGVEFGTDWVAGSPVVWRERDVETRDPEQVVLEAEPYRRLSYTWHTFTPEWARRNGIDDGTLARLSAERRSGVTFEIEDLGGSGTVKLTVVHDGFEPGSTAREMIQHGWPALLSGLKTLLETGETLPDPDQAPELPGA
ncbi:ArsR/SmtB family transcription factor [Streptomyces mayonensis]|uniref:ArsR/SmtB family transcription factor n=1 Tax=Streptomyces mayonensis TaxID=2750816 RepID=UPI001C1E28E0|nr:metalloregulator ArsR/SmtB family transcription factor [Streptomyces sp. A108]MBU6531163.1 metalloregulator ArsR/SmtB family transcription factor [Streptomyces sp. A108]